MSHPMSVYLKASTRRGKRGIVDTVYLVCEWQGGKWWPMLDHPPSYEEAPVIRYAAERLRAGRILKGLASHRLPLMRDRSAAYLMTGASS